MSPVPPRPSTSARQETSASSRTSSPPTDELRQLCKTRLAPYMLPSAFMQLDAFPTTPNRKLDRRALPAPDGIRRDLERSYAAPETPVEESLVEIWSDVLGVDRVGIDDD